MGSVSRSSHLCHNFFLSSKSITVVATVGIVASLSVALGIIILSGHGALFGVVGVVGEQAASAFIVIGAITLLGEFAVISCCQWKKMREEESSNSQTKEKGDSTASHETESLSEEEDPAAFQHILEESEEAFLAAKKALPERPLKDRNPASETVHGHYTQLKEGKVIFSPVYALTKSAPQKLNEQLDFAVRKGFTERKGFNFAITSTDLRKIQDNKIKDKNIGAASAWNPQHRKEMEDAHAFKEFSFKFHGKEKAVKFACVCDGHGDNGEIAQYVSKAMPKRIGEILAESEKLDETSITNALTESFVITQQKIEEEPKFVNGTTVTCALVIDRRVYVANCGDSVTALIKKKIAYKLTEDANPVDPRFKNTIKNMGRQLLRNSVEGYLNVARDLGITDVSPRPKITPILKGAAEDDLEKMIIYYQRNNYLCLVCDGLWDVLNIEELYAAIRLMDLQGLSPKEMAAQLVYNAMKNGSRDNITVVVMKLS